MLIYAVAFAGGLLAIVSPCILPVLPLVFARADQPFRRTGLPLLAGMAVTFVAAGALATAAGDWIVRANQIGRDASILLFALFGAALLFPGVGDRLSRPFVRLGGALQQRTDARPSIAGSMLLGMATGLLWTPCAGPILGLILTGAAVEGSTVRSVVLLLAFAAGSATALAVALVAGNRALQIMKRGLGAEAWIRRGLGVAVLAGVLGIAMGWDTGLLARVSLTSAVSTTGMEQRLLDRVEPASTETATTAPSSGAMMAASPAAMMSAGAEQAGAPEAIQGPMPPLSGAVAWLNSPALTREALRGKVVMIDFWTYSCINCLRAIPYVQAWADKYASAGLVVIGVHAPEFAFERDRANVEKAVKDLRITYPVAVDSNRVIWNAFKNHTWPAHYFIDSTGVIRAHHFGEGNYQETEQIIQELLAGRNGVKTTGFVTVTGAGVQAAPDFSAVKSPETYVGYARQANFASPEELVRDDAERYSSPVRPRVNQWGLEGWWKIGEENAVLSQGKGKITFRFHARDLHLVLGPKSGGKPVRFRVTIDGAPPLDDAGIDVDAQGNGTVTSYRLYQLVRQKAAVEDRTFQIEFLDPDVQAFAFTFG
ncbi:MAG TPA: cytochrome c biogenesis protein DipZ [Vicinamibacterales bacterium]|nr:cytochrome c biogenesis protein DipZ [Vicinamibacterales bacterium]